MQNNTHMIRYLNGTVYLTTIMREKSKRPQIWVYNLNFV